MFTSEMQSKATLIAMALAACSSPAEKGLFEGDDAGVAQTGGVSSSSTTTVSSTTGSATANQSASAASSTSAATTSSGSTTSISSGGSTAASSGATSTTGALQTTATSTGLSGGVTSTTSAVSTTGASSPTTAEVELEENADCQELACPDAAPHLVGCDIVFSSPGPLSQACLALEANSRVFVMSGLSCSGNQIASGTLLCSSEPSDNPLDETTCVAQNKDEFAIVEGRCQCPGGAPGCP